MADKPVYTYGTTHPSLQMYGQKQSEQDKASWLSIRFNHSGVKFNAKWNHPRMDDKTTVSLDYTDFQFLLDTIIQYSELSPEELSKGVSTKIVGQYFKGGSYNNTGVEWTVLGGSKGIALKITIKGTAVMFPFHKPTKMGLHRMVDGELKELSPAEYSVVRAKYWAKEMSRLMAQLDHEKLKEVYLENMKKYNGGGNNYNTSSSVADDDGWD